MFRLLCRLDANSQIGFGHLARIALLAQEWKRRGHEICFASRDRLDRTHWFAKEWQFVPIESEDDFSLLAEQAQPDAVLCDLPQYESAGLTELRARFPLIVFDDYQTEPLPADLLVNTQVLWKNAPCDSRQRILGGSMYALIKHQTGLSYAGADDRSVIVTMGGSDPNNMTTRVLNWLRDGALPARLTVVLGPGYRHESDLQAALADYPCPVEIQRSVREMLPLLASHTIAVSAVGVTLYELASLGVPTIALVEEARSEWMIAAMQQAGTLKSVSLPQAEEGRLAAEVAALLSDETRRERMSQAGRSLVDGRGAQRLVHAIADRIAPASDRQEPQMQ